MKGNIRTLKLLLLTAAAILPVVCSSFMTEPEDKNPRIIGIVTDEDSVRLAGVRVTTYDEEWTCLTDSDGRFSFDSLDTGTYDLRFTLQGYETGIVEDIELSDEHPGRKFWVMLRYPTIPRPVSGSFTCRTPEIGAIYSEPTGDTISATHQRRSALSYDSAAIASSGTIRRPEAGSSRDNNLGF